MVSVAFYLPEDDLMVSLWDHLVRAYGVAPYVVGGEEGGTWTPIDTLDEAPGTRWFIQSASGKLTQGQHSLYDVSIPDDVTLCFGSDDKHNGPVDCVISVFIPTPRPQVTLYAVQAAHIALDHWWHHGDR